MKKRMSGLLALLLVLAGCTSQTPPVSESTSEPVSEPSANSTIPESMSTASIDAVTSEVSETLPTPSEYIRQAVTETAAQIVTPDMSEYEKVKATFDYLITNCTYAKPVALDAWRFRSSGVPEPSYIEVRSQSILNYGIGTCEDYSAAMILLLEEMGIEARYVPGITYTSSGVFCDHAWVVAKVDEVWYHLDCQLEDGISRNNTIQYRYFMKSDATMRASHMWGQDLADSGRLMPDQREELLENYLTPTCPQDYATPSANTFTPVPSGDKAEIESALLEELQEYEAQNGVLEPIDIDRIPPVFGRYRGYNRHNNTSYNEAENLALDYDTVLIPEPRQNGDWILQYDFSSIYA